MTEVIFLSLVLTTSSEQPIFALNDEWTFGWVASSGIFVSFFGQFSPKERYKYQFFKFLGSSVFSSQFSSFHRLVVQSVVPIIVLRALSPSVVCFGFHNWQFLLILGRHLRKQSIFLASSGEMSPLPVHWLPIVTRGVPSPEREKQIFLECVAVQFCFSGLF